MLLALATVATAWAAYQARQWTGEQAQATSRATADRIAENRDSALANREVQIDVATFIQWLDARALDRPGLAAFSAWLATRPFADPSAPPTPFAMRQYRLKATADAERVERAAAVASDHSKDANQRADNYMLAVVLFASSLFFAGISSKIESAGARTVGPRARLRALPRRRRVARDVAGEARHLGARSITRFG